MTALSHAIQSALDNPIGRFIPDVMKFDYATRKAEEIVEWDWEAEALLAIEEKKKSGK